MNPSLVHGELLATYQRAKADALHKQGLISAAGRKGPKAIQAAVDTAARARKRQDGFAKKLAALGVVVEQ
jgi:hypothetical protein